MKRYAATFFRYWILALLPVLILPLGALVLMHPKPYGYGVTNVWVDQQTVQQLNYVEPNATPAYNMAAYLTQLLASPSFEDGVARRSPQYLKWVSRFPNPRQAAEGDIAQNTTFTASGSLLLTVIYVNQNPVIARGIVQSLLKQAAYQVSQFNNQQASKQIATYQKQLKNAQAQYVLATQRLSSYITNNGISPAQLDLKRLADAKLAMFYQATLTSQADVSSAEQRLATARSQATPLAFHVIDPPAARVTVMSKKKQLAGLMIPLVLGLLLGGAFIVIRTLLDRAVYFADEVPELLGLPVLAVIPHEAQLAARRRRASRWRPTRAASAGRG